MSYVRIWIHAVFATKNREPHLTETIRPTLNAHVLKNALLKNIHVECTNGYDDHLHCLFLLPNGLTVGKALMLIKGESSHWLNNQQLTDRYFAWQDDYFAVSVSESLVGKVREYIHNQDMHHRTTTFQEETEEFARKYGWDMGYFFKKAK